MRVLKRLNECPPEGFKYTHAETGHTTVAVDPSTWLEKAKEHRRANGLPIPDDFFSQMQDQLCQHLPPELWETDRGDKSWVDTRLNGDDVYEASKIYLEWRSQGKPFVPQEEAERRASICAGCYLNVRVLGCGGWCRKLIQVVIDSRGEHKTSHDDKLLNCAVCKCVNASQVHFPLTLLEISDTPQRQIQYVPQCWKNRASPNYKIESQP